MSVHPAHAQLIRNLAIVDKRMDRAAQRLGLNPYPTDFVLVNDEVMRQNLVYVAMPVHYGHWRSGLHAQQSRTGQVAEVVINSNPSLCYLGLSNDMAMQILVVAHAKYGHVDFFKNNSLYAETGAETVLERFRTNAEFVDALVGHPDWRQEGVDLWLDAAHSLEQLVGWLPTLPGENDVSEEVYREELIDELRRLKELHDRTSDQFDREQMQRSILELESRLKHHPLRPTGDILGFLADPANTPHIPTEARQLLKIVREQARYFQPQGRTKFMNEGWATYWEREVMVQPELALPFNLRYDASKYWAMFDRTPLNWYLDPYGLGEQLWRFIDQQYCYDDGVDDVRYQDLEWNPDTNLLTEGKRWRTESVVRRNRDRMFQIRQDYDDNRFLAEFISKEFFEHVNSKALGWLRGTPERVGLMQYINDRLRQLGWGAPFVVETLPETIDGLIEVTQAWTSAAQNSVNWQQRLGTPPFPVRLETLQQMGQVLQIIASYDEDWRRMRHQLVMRTGYNSVPVIHLVDTGRHTDGVWTLRHSFNPDFGPLKESDARETLQLFRLLSGAPSRLLTMEVDTDPYGRPGNPYPFIYFTEDGDTVLEQRV